MHVYTIHGTDMRPFIHTYTERLSTDCNEMSNQLCQIACQPGGEKKKGVCAKAVHLLHLPHLLSLFNSSYSSSFSISGSFSQRRRVEHCFPPGATEQRGASARTSRLLSLKLRSEGEEHMADCLLIWIQMRQKGKRDEAAQCASDV